MRSDRSSAIGYLACGLILFAAFYWFGTYVTAHGEPPALLSIAHQMRGQAIGLAWAFTNCGWIQVLGPLYLICIYVAVRFAQWRSRMIFLIACGLLSWIAASGFQVFFGRPRRPDWLLRHEHAFSYPSSHASTSTGFYLLAGILILRSELPARLRYPAFALLTAMWLGICWSRLSLAAHYPTDVAGGIALGFAIIFLVAAADAFWRARSVRAAN